MNRLIENKMEKPSLKEVKEYFKNAKIIIPAWGNKVETYINTSTIRFDCDDYWVTDETGSKVCLVDLYKEPTFAEIVEYKDSVLEELPGIIASKSIIQVASIAAKEYQNKKAACVFEKQIPKIDPIVTSVMTQFLTRSQVGINKYGTTLEENNTDDFLQHLKEELMDAVLYIEKLQSNGKK